MAWLRSSACSGRSPGLCAQLPSESTGECEDLAFSFLGQEVLDAKSLVRRHGEGQSTPRSRRREGASEHTRARVTACETGTQAPTHVQSPHGLAAPLLHWLLDKLVL